jgi:hypothetical protein
MSNAGAATETRIEVTNGDGPGERIVTVDLGDSIAFALVVTPADGSEPEAEAVAAIERSCVDVMRDVGALIELARITILALPGFMEANNNPRREATKLLANTRLDTTQALAGAMMFLNLTNNGKTTTRPVCACGIGAQLHGALEQAREISDGPILPAMIDALKGECEAITWLRERGDSARSVLESYAAKFATIERDAASKTPAQGGADEAALVSGALDDAIAGKLEEARGGRGPRLA